MNGLSEAEKLYLMEGDLEGLTGWADDEDDEDDEEGKVSSAEARELIKKIFKIGSERVAELEKHLKPHNNGNFYIPNSATGQYADFYQQANLKHFKEKYPWLHEYDQQIGLDPDQAGKTDGDFERLLAKVPAMDWQQFLEDIDYVTHNYEIDDQAAQELEMEEQSRWLKEDGIGDLRTALLKNTSDSFSAFVFSWVNEDTAWEACRFSSNYPEGDGQGGVYLDMDVLAEDEETRDFILKEMKPERFRARWEKIKRLTFETRGVGTAFAAAVKKHILHDAEAARLYDNMSAGEFYKFFLKAIPDSAYRDDARAYWYQFHEFSHSRGRIERKWTVGRMTEYDPHHKTTGSTKNESAVMQDALDNLMALPATMALFKRVGHREPEDHPELPLESLREALGDEDEPNPEDPRQAELIPFDPAENEGKPLTFKDELDEPNVDYIKSKGHLRVDRVYSDQSIDIVRPRDRETFDALVAAFNSPHPPTTGRDLERTFVVRRARTFAPLLIFMEYPYELQYWQGSTWHMFTSSSLSRIPEGKSVKKWLEARYMDMAEHDAEKVPLLFQIGGVRAIARLEKTMGVRYSEFDTVMAITAGLQGKVKAAVDYLQHDSRVVVNVGYQDADRKGVWISFKDWGAFTSMFDNEESAQSALDGETYDWFENLWEQKPTVESMLPYLTKEAIDHIRYLILGREVWYPDRNEYAPLTRDVLNQVDNDTVLDWIANPDTEDQETEVFEDIREAIQNGGVRMLEMAGRDQVTQRYEKEIVDSIDPIKHEWRGDHLAFYMGWDRLHVMIGEYEEENNSTDVGIHDLLRFRINKLEPRIDDLPDWPEHKGPYAQAYAEEACMELMELHRREPPEDKNQLPLLPEALDDEAPTKFDFINNVPIAAEREIKRAVETVCRANNRELVEFSAKMHPATNSLPFIDFDFRINPPLPKDAEVDLYWIVRKTGTNALAQQGLIPQQEFIHQWKPEEGLLGIRFYVYRVNEPNWQPPTRLEYLERNESTVSNESPVGIGA